MLKQQLVAADDLTDAPLIIAAISVGIGDVMNSKEVLAGSVMVLAHDDKIRCCLTACLTSNPQLQFDVTTAVSDLAYRRGEEIVAAAAVDPQLAGQAREQAEWVIQSFVQPLHWTIEIQWGG